MQTEDPNFDSIFQAFVNKLKNKQPNRRMSLLGRQIFNSCGEQRLDILRSLRDMLSHCSNTIEDYPGFEVSIEDFKEWANIRNEFFDDLQIRLAFEQLTDFQPGGSSEDPYGYTICLKNHNGLLLRFHNPLILEKIVNEIEKQVSCREDTKNKNLAKKCQEEKENKKQEMRVLREKGKADIPNRIAAAIVGGLCVAFISNLSAVWNWIKDLL